MIRHAALTIEKLENVSIEELKQLGKLEEVEAFRGIVYFDSEYNEEFLKASTVDDILVFVKKLEGINRYRKSLGIIRNALREYYIGYEAKTFSVRASYIGRRDYTSAEIVELAKNEIKFKNKWKFVEGYGDVHINIILHEDISLIGVSISDKPLFEKGYTPVPGSLRSSLANCMLKLGDVKSSDKVLDPMCGSGIIAIEASKLSCETFGSDIEGDYIEIAKKNAGKMNVNFSVKDATDTGFPDGFFDKVICNLPFGKQVKVDENFYPKFIKEMNRIAKKDAVFVLLTKSDLSKALKEVHLNYETLSIVNSGIELNILIIKK